MSLQQLSPEVHHHILAFLCNDAHAITRLGRCNSSWHNMCLSGTDANTFVLWQKLCWYRWYAVKEHPDRVAHFRDQNQDVMPFHGTLAQLRSLYRERHVADIRVFWLFCDLCNAYVSMNDDERASAAQDHEYDDDLQDCHCYGEAAEPSDSNEDHEYRRYDDISGPWNSYDDIVPCKPSEAWKRTLTALVRTADKSFSKCPILWAIIRQDASYGLFPLHAGASIPASSDRRWGKRRRWRKHSLSNKSVVSSMWHSLMTTRAASSLELEQTNMADYAGCMALCLAYAAHMLNLGRSMDAIFSASGPTFDISSNRDEFWACLAYIAVLEFSPSDILCGAQNGAAAMRITVGEIVNEMQPHLPTSLIATKIDTFALVTAALDVVNQRYGLYCNHTFDLVRFSNDLPWFECHREQRLPFMFDILLRLVLYEFNFTEWVDYQARHGLPYSDGLGNEPLLIGSSSEDWFIDLTAQSGVPWDLTVAADLTAVFGENFHLVTHGKRRTLSCLLAGHLERHARRIPHDTWGWKNNLYTSFMYSAHDQIVGFGPFHDSAAEHYPDKKYFDRGIISELWAYKQSLQNPWHNTL